MAIEVLNGNELIVQGGLEAGFSLYTGYPGSPLADYFNILEKRKPQLKEKGIQVVLANSEANAAAMASGAKQAGRDCLVAMKSMGLHVAADALSVGNFADPGKEVGGLYPGVVIVVGDDPWSISTSTPADSRYLFKHLHIPFLEPATPQELKDSMKTALSLSKQTGIYQGVLLTTFMAEGGGRVETSPWAKVEKELKTLDTSKFNLEKLVMVPPNSLKADISMNLQRFPQVKKALNSSKLDQTYGSESSKIGFISSGATFETLKQVLEEKGYLDRFGLFKAASSYPLTEEKLLPWREGKEALIVVEEKRGFLEGELIHLFSKKNKKEIELLGKDFRGGEGFPAFGGLSYEIISTKIDQALELLGIETCKNTGQATAHWDKPSLPPRLPTFCPGCPHRETLSLLKELRGTLAAKDIDLVSHGDVGCYSLSFLPPFKEMHNLSAMGQGGALGAGVDIFSKNPSVVLMGDSTFYHSGITDISNSVQMDHSITYILLDNDNTAMTGHQPTPAGGINVQGESRPRQNMLKAVLALGVSKAVEVNPSDRYFYKNLLEDFVLQEGVKVIVSNKECALTFLSREKAKQRKIFAHEQTLPVQNFYRINTAVCEDCRECVEMTGCPGLTKTEDAYGDKVTIDPQICVGDSYCTKLKACPSFDLVQVYKYHPSKYRIKDDANNDEKNSALPTPMITTTFADLAEGRDFRIVVTGVGGSGVTTISRVLAEAAREMGGRDDLGFKFVDQKGLAQRNGNVTAHLCLYAKGKSCSATTPEGKGDLLLSPDLLDGASHLELLGEKGLCVLNDNFQIPISLMLDDGVGGKPLDAVTLRQKLENTLGEHVKILPFKRVAQDILGKGVYTSAMLLGAAYQSGRLPFHQDDLLKAFEKTVPEAELDNNLKAFRWGRKLFLEVPKQYLQEKDNDAPNEIQHLRLSLGESLLPWQSRKKIIQSFDSSLERLRELFPEIKKSHLAHYIHDIYVYDRGKHIEDFFICAQRIGELYENKNSDKLLALRTLAKTYWIKDEVFVAHQMISHRQKKKDHEEYASLGKRYRVVHINRPSFSLGYGKVLEFDLSPKDWMLGIMRHLRFLRKVLPGWHDREREIARKVRLEILEKVPLLKQDNKRKRLQTLENIKGYRSVRYLAAKKAGLL